jgi:hypothetical protein
VENEFKDIISSKVKLGELIDMDKKKSKAPCTLSLEKKWVASKTLLKTFITHQKIFKM